MLEVPAATAAASAGSPGSGVGDPLRGRDRVSAPLPESGPGTFRVAEVTRPPPAGTRTRYSVEVEDNLEASGLLAGSVAAEVSAVLSHRRGWVGGQAGLLEPTDTDPDLRILLATPATTDRLCAPLNTRGELSCRNGQMVVLNARRWTRGAPAYAGRLPGYRRYLVNHEVGHALGNGHATCPGPGRPAPVMLQQTLGLDGCRPNPWPRP
ncbi:hypothetical protein I601_4044 [Nocardioides dokdonensis FR1436]|uniref:DUF3152 domain-containing protein n=1 Tax=Nocardioides dokdonensis FR1436 TaxID=1300347 RepID=A0A1A9GRW2_9ACTN|nr:DUF3152 domain-containing protein [Nocardioides dokdonensis]ANH40440.1 hypothetical protein I601_4044 [Nocardioides dokdonensis FR1436]